MRQFFNSAENKLAELPGGPIANFLEGALLMVRRSYFNQAPRVSPSSQTTSGDGSISGQIGAYDLEGDRLTYTVTGDPQLGTVTLESGYYTYTPSLEYDGADSFTVKITPERRSLNIFDLARDGSREVTIQVGTPTLYDNPDVAVNLSDTSGHITIQRSGFNQFTGTVTLTNVTPDSQAMWIDTSGRLGRISLEALTKNYWEFKARAAENGATVDLTLAYSGADGTKNALLLNNVELAVDAGGQYVFTGQVAPNPKIETTAVDVWDVVGKEYKPMFDKFRKTYGIESAWKFRTVDIDFTGGDFYADTITPLSYQRTGLYAQDSESRPSAAGPSRPPEAPTTSAPVLAEAGATAVLSPVTVAISSGATAIIGHQDGSVDLWTDGEKKQLQDTGWNSSVTTLLEYDRPLKDDQGNTIYSTFNGYISGTTLTVTGTGLGSKVAVGSEIVGDGVAPGTRITKFVEQGAKCLDATCSETSGSGAGGSNGYTGTYEVSISQKVSSPVPSVSPDDPSALMPAGIVFTQKNVPAVAPGFIAGLANGSIELYSATSGWTELHGFETAWGGVKSIVPYLDGFVVGLDNGLVRKWIGPTTNATTGSDANDPSTWRNNWEVIYQPGSKWDVQTPSPKYDGSAMSAFNPSAAVTVVVQFRDRPDICPGDSGKGCAGFLVGRADGSVLEYNEGQGGAGKPGWVTLYETDQNSPVVGIVEYKTLIGGNDYLPSFAFGLQNGYLGEWKWQPKDDQGASQIGKYGVERIGTPGAWGGDNQITSMAQLDRGFVVGLKNSSVQLRDATTNRWIELRDAGWSANTFNDVTTIIPFSSDGVTASGKQGVIVGLDNGSVQAWTGNITGTKNGNPWGQNDWIQVHGVEWSNRITIMAPTAIAGATNEVGDPVTRDGVIVGLNDGSVYQWSGLIPAGNTGQGDWKTLQAMKNKVTDALSRREDLTCSKLRCSTPGAVLEAVAFAKQLDGKDIKADVRSADDPIFSDSSFWAAGDTGDGKKYGTYTSLAFNTDLSPYSYSTSKKVEFTGMVDTYTNPNGLGKPEVGAGGNYSILTIPSFGTENGTSKLLNLKIEDGSLLETNSAFRNWGDSRVQPGTRIVRELTEKEKDVLPWAGEFTGGGGRAESQLEINSRCKTGPCRYFVLDGLNQYVQLTELKATASPNFKAALEFAPVTYGYMWVPDGFLAKFHPGNYSAAVFLGVEMGPRVDVDLAAGKAGYAFGKPHTLKSYQASMPIAGIFTGQINAGLTVSGGVTAIGLNASSSLTAYAHFIPAMALTYNTKASPGAFDFAASWAFDANANDVYDAVTSLGSMSGISATVTFTPYFNLLFGMMVPPKIPLIGGWSVFSSSLGLEAPVSATVCVDSKRSCAAGGSGSGVVNFDGVINDGTFSTADRVVGGDAALKANPVGGNVLTVTKKALFSNTKLAVGQLVKGPGVTEGTTIKSYIGSSDYGDQYEVSISQTTVGDGTSKTRPSLSAYLSGAPQSLTLDAQALLTVHAGLLEAFTSKLSYDMKVPLYQLNLVFGPEPISPYKTVQAIGNTTLGGT